jgi:hypothetical protein
MQAGLIRVSKMDAQCRIDQLVRERGELVLMAELLDKVSVLSRCDITRTTGHRYHD